MYDCNRLRVGLGFRITIVLGAGCGIIILLFDILTNRRIAYLVSTRWREGSKERQIRELMRQEGLCRMIYTGFVIPPSVVQSWGIGAFHDADFYYINDDEPFSPREFILNSPTRVRMETILKLVLEMGEAKGFEFRLMMP